MLAEMNYVAAMVVALAATNASDETSAKYRGGSKPGQAVSRDFEIEEKYEQLKFIFFCRYGGSELVFAAAEFERTYRMPQNLYEKTRSDFAEYDRYF